MSAVVGRSDGVLSVKITCVLSGKVELWTIPTIVEGLSQSLHGAHQVSTQVSNGEDSHLPSLWHFLVLGTLSTEAL